MERLAIQPVILSGGSGTRLWPLSRERYPKQLLPLIGDDSLFQATVARVRSVEGIAAMNPLVVSNEEYRFVIAEQLRLMGAEGTLLLEPAGRNTAPALTLAALEAVEYGSDPVLFVMPADHLISDVSAFHAAIRAGTRLAAAGAVVTFGVTPDRPETGYGYIEGGESLDGGEGRCIARFVEKPDRHTAESYLATGRFYWNSGLFVVRASVWLKVIERFRADIAAACRQAWKGVRSDGAFRRVDAEAFRACPPDSIDYAVMEPLAAGGADLPPAVVIPLSAGWSDVGAWSALWEVLPKDAEGNVVRGDVALEGCRDTLAISEARFVACVGVKDLVVVETADAVLVADQSRTQDVKRIVESLKAEGRSEGELHRKAVRPWGWYDGVDAGDRFQVKRIVVNPGAALSLQMHHHRAEHWIVVKGTARVTRGDETFLVTENESTFIPLGIRHRLENPGKLPLEMIEVQSGSYLGEDDIVRFEDVYGR